MTAPYYDDGGITIYHGDCRELMAALTCDVVITDPPYGTGFYPTDTDSLTSEQFAMWARGGPFAVFGWAEKLAGYIAATGCVPTEWVTWWPTNARNRGFCQRGLLREAEHVAVYGDWAWERLRQPHARTTTPMPPKPRGKAHPDGARAGDVWTEESPQANMNQKGRLHPNEKPLAVMRRLVAASDGVVFDPFMGSGTTLRAAKDLGRKAVGVELDERYCEIAAKRLAQEVLALG